MGLDRRSVIWGVGFALVIHLIAALFLFTNWKGKAPPPPTPIMNAEVVDPRSLPAAQRDPLRPRAERETRKPAPAPAPPPPLKEEPKPRPKPPLAPPPPPKESVAEVENAIRLKKEKDEAKKREEAKELKKKEEERLRQEELKEELVQEERQRKEEAKRKKAEVERQRKEKEQQELKTALAEEERAANSQADKARVASELEKYTGQIRVKVENAFNQPEGTKGLACDIFIRLARTGEVMEARVTRSSGNPAFDSQAERAVRKASPLPVPGDAAVFDALKEFTFEFKPE
jgi:colicin import membrane protein